MRGKGKGGDGADRADRADGADEADEADEADRVQRGPARCHSEAAGRGDEQPTNPFYTKTLAPRVRELQILRADPNLKGLARVILQAPQSRWE